MVRPSYAAVCDLEVYLPNAAIAWKQSNGFYYPPAFHSNNLVLRRSNEWHLSHPALRHRVAVPPQTPTRHVPRRGKEASSHLSGSTVATGLFIGYTDVDRQTELNDDDGSLTGLIDTISVNKDPFSPRRSKPRSALLTSRNNMPPLGQKCASR